MLLCDYFFLAQGFGFIRISGLSGGSTACELQSADQKITFQFYFNSLQSRVWAAGGATVAEAWEVFFFFSTSDM